MITTHLDERRATGRQPPSRAPMMRCGAPRRAGSGRGALLLVSACALACAQAVVQGQTWTDLLRGFRESDPEASSRAESSPELSGEVQEVRRGHWHNESGDLTTGLVELGTFVDGGERFDLWGNEHLVLVRMSERSYRELADLKEMTWPVFRQIRNDIILNAVAKMLYKVPKVAAAIAVLSGADDLYFVASQGDDYWEWNFPSSRVVLYAVAREGGFRDRVYPGKAYSLDIFFKTAASQCLWSGDGCWLDIELNLDVHDRFDYYLDPPPLAAGLARALPWMHWCFGGYLKDGLRCLRLESAEPVSFPIGHLRIEPGHYWIIPREPITFDVPRPAPRTGETVQAFKVMQLSDSKGLFSRDTIFPIDLPDAEELRARPGHEADARWRPGDVFRDCDECPEMVVLPGGRLALGRYEVTVGEYRAFVSATGGTGNERWRNPEHSQTDRHPVVIMRWNDAQAYVSWLSRRSGATYRLPTEAEWDRGASGSQPGCFRERTGRWGTCPVGNYGANEVGLSDMVGNVWEWTSGCWEGDCGDRVLRGGGWANRAEALGPGSRGIYTPGAGWDDYGFRVSRTLD